MSLTYDENRAYWNKRQQNSNLYKDLTFLNQMALATARGTMKKSQIASGPGGIGKNYIYENAFKVEKRKYMVIKAGTVLGILQDLEHCAKRGKVALIDDPRRSLLESEEFQLILMAATGPNPREYPYSTNGERRVYKFAGLQIVVLTNINLTGSRGMSKRVSEMMAPMLGRMYNIAIQENRLEMFQYACYLAICKDLLKSCGLSFAASNVALEYFSENMHRMPDVSTRSLIKIAEMMLMLPDCWREGLDRELTKEQTHGQPYTGEVPMLVLPPRRAA